MREWTNLQWPEAPFGADQRTFGTPARMITAVAVDWDTEGRPAAAAVAYLRVKRSGAVEVSTPTVNPGFVTVAPDGPGDVGAVCDWLDRVLVRARIKAAVLAGYDLADTLTRISALVDVPMGGVAGVADAWLDRSATERTAKIARMIDTAHDLAEPAGSAGRVSGVSLSPDGPEPPPVNDREQTDAALLCATRALAIGLVVAWDIGAYRWPWPERLNVANALTHAAWDIFDTAAAPAGA